MSSIKGLEEDPKHLDDCHERWMLRRHRVQEAEGYRDEWRRQQCFNCQYFIPLTGVFADDYGVCSNANAEADGLVRFEHDGCDKHLSCEESAEDST